MDDIVVARTLHVLAVVIWIGGVAMVTTVIFPAIRRGDLGADRSAAFRAIQRRFVWQARAAVVLVGLTGFYMTAKLDLWARFRSAEFWWMPAMAGLWFLFTFILFVAAPLRGRPGRGAASVPDRDFARMHRIHRLLLALSLVTVFGAVAGSHGWAFF